MANANKRYITNLLVIVYMEIKGDGRDNSEEIYLFGIGFFGVYIVLCEIDGPGVVPVVGIVDREIQIPVEPPADFFFTVK